jgi:hypothetical protein
MENITIPDIPRFIFSPNPDTMELFITCTKPLALIWIRQTIPAQLYIVEGSQDEEILKSCAEWYRVNAGDSVNSN